MTDESIDGVAFVNGFPVATSSQTAPASPAVLPASPLAAASPDTIIPEPETNQERSGVFERAGTELQRGYNHVRERTNHLRDNTVGTPAKAATAGVIATLALGAGLYGVSRFSSSGSIDRTPYGPPSPDAIRKSDQSRTDFVPYGLGAEAVIENVKNGQGSAVIVPSLDDRSDSNVTLGANAPEGHITSAQVLIPDRHFGTITLTPDPENMINNATLAIPQSVFSGRRIAIRKEEDSMVIALMGDGNNQFIVLKNGRRAVKRQEGRSTVYSTENVIPVSKLVITDNEGKVLPKSDFFNFFAAPEQAEAQLNFLAQTHVPEIQGNGFDRFAAARMEVAISGNEQYAETEKPKDEKLKDNGRAFVRRARGGGPGNTIIVNGNPGQLVIERGKDGKPQARVILNGAPGEITHAERVEADKKAESGPPQR